MIIPKFYENGGKGSGSWFLGEDRLLRKKKMTSLPRMSSSLKNIPYGSGLPTGMSQRWPGCPCGGLRRWAGAACATGRGDPTGMSQRCPGCPWGGLMVGLAVAPGCTGVCETADDDTGIATAPLDEMLAASCLSLFT